jgi:hypothetical protein
MHYGIYCEKKRDLSAAFLLSIGNRNQNVDFILRGKFLLATKRLPRNRICDKNTKEHQEMHKEFTFGLAWPQKRKGDSSAASLLFYRELELELESQAK